MLITFKARDFIYRTDISVGEVCVGFVGVLDVTDRSVLGSIGSVVVGCSKVVLLVGVVGVVAGARIDGEIGAILTFKGSKVHLVFEAGDSLDNIANEGGICKIIA